MPVFNEYSGLRAAVEEIEREILDRIDGATLLVVDDGSTDGSGALLDELVQNDGRIRVLHQRNRGHGSALMAGLAAIKSEYVFLVDSDRQIPIEWFSALWTAVRAGSGAAVGVRRRRRDALTRIALTILIRRVVCLLFSVHVHDANVPFKLVRRADWLAVRPLIPEGTLAPSLFLGLFLRLRGIDVAEIDVVHRDRRTGTVSVRGYRMAKFCVEAFVQLLRFRRTYRRTVASRERGT